MSFRRLWTAFGLVVVLSFAVLGWTGLEIYQQAPPVPERVITNGGATLIGPDDVFDGQNIWQSMGGMEVGSIWGHGSYVAPDWTADWLHRESLFILDRWSGAPGGYAALEPERQAELQSRLQQLLRTNTYDGGTITIDPVRAEAFAANLAHYSDVFGNGREDYAIPAGALTDRENQRKLAAFFFWTSWAASTNRPGDDVTYTSNWPHEPLVGNRPTGDTIVWTGVSIIVLLAGIGLMASYYASIREHGLPAEAPATDPLLGSVATPSEDAGAAHPVMASRKRQDSKAGNRRSAMRDMADSFLVVVCASVPFATSRGGERHRHQALVAQVSRRVTLRLNTGRSGVWS